MASPKCPPSAPQRLENTTRKFSGSSDLARRKSMVCMKAVPFRKQRNMRSSATTLSGRREPHRTSTCSEIHQSNQGFDNGRDCYRTRWKHPARPVEPPYKAERDDVSHVPVSRKHLQRGGE